MICKTLQNFAPLNFYIANKAYLLHTNIYIYLLCSVYYFNLIADCAQKCEQYLVRGVYSGRQAD